MFNCVLCQDAPCYLSNMCDECVQIRRIINLYGREECLNILRRVCIREKEQRDNKIAIELGDESYTKHIKWVKKDDKNSTK